MKTISKLAGGLALAAISSSAMAGGIGIAQTKHNLGAGNLTGGNYTLATTEVCIFCHTPHGADQSASAPLWNRQLSDSSIYTRYSALGTSTFDADEVAVGSVSIACLSCHDGTQAMDAVLNSPGGGSGFTNNQTSSLGLVNNSTATDGGDSVGGLTGGFGTGGDSGGWNEGHQMSSLGGTAINGPDNGNTGDLIYIGTDLRNDHPVSMQYGGGGITTGGTSLVDPDYATTGATPGSWGTNVSVGGTGVVNIMSVGTMPVWYVDTGSAGKQKSDMPLYTRNVDGFDQPYVECATCHDPHSNNGVFLRAPFVSQTMNDGTVTLGTGGGNGGSQVCLACHAK